MHCFLSDLVPHAFPRHSADVTILRVRVDHPLPQPLLQIDQDVQADITQSRLLYCEQDVVCLSAGQDLPLQEGWVVMLRVLVLVPEKKIISRHDEPNRAL